MGFFKNILHQTKSTPELYSKFRRALGYAEAQKKPISVILLLTLVVSGVGVVEPLVMKFIFDSLTGDNLFRDLAFGVAMLSLIVLTRESLSGVSNYFTWRARLSIHYGLLGATVGRLHRLPIDFHKRQGVGAVMTRLERGIQGFVSTISELAFNAIPAIFYLILAIVFMLMLDWRMTILVLIFTPVPGIIAAYAAPFQKIRERTLMDKWAKIYSRFNEVLSGIMTVKSFAMEDREKKRFLEDVKEANTTVINGVRFDTGIGAMQNIIIALARITTIAFGAYLVYLGEITIGTLIAFLGYIGALFGPVQGLTGIYKTIHTGSVSLEHIFSILDTQDLLGDAPDAVDVDLAKGEVLFDNISFRFNQESSFSLSNVKLQVKPGEHIAFVGPSGSGKSTIMALLQRFYDPDEGAIYLDGIDIKQIKQLSIRKNIGVVLQDALLFNESIFDNIAYGRPGAKREEVYDAAIAANAHDFIMTLENGYETIVGERGNRLSIGERQRIAIARALLKDPPILILDEATSALDAELETLIQEALDKLTANRTTFVIAHRLATVVNADRIIVFKAGRIIESGSHPQLIEQNGYYASLVKKQTRGLITPELIKDL
jgi:ATP-binding cassette, subfamily B, bacterial